MICSSTSQQSSTADPGPGLGGPSDEAVSSDRDISSSGRSPTYRCEERWDERPPLMPVYWSFCIHCFKAVLVLVGSASPMPRTSGEQGDAAAPGCQINCLKLKARFSFFNLCLFSQCMAVCSV